MATLVQIQETPRWKKLLGFVGPGFLVSVAYLDPGNLETDLQAGADQKYELLWIVFLGLAYALIIQSRSANLGVVTGKHLSEHCKTEYPNPVNYGLWVLAELAVIAADIPEVIGTAVALNMLFKVPIWAGVLLAGLSTLLLLGLQRYGIRKLEIVIGILLLVVGGCFFAVMVHARPSPEDILVGMFVPKLRDGQATRDAVALLGALIMPHNLYLHSALVISRKIPHTTEAIRTASKYFTIESGIALFFTFLINISVVSLTASVCSRPTLSPGDLSHCKDITLQSAAFLLKSVLGNWSSKLFAVSLLASGQSSTVTGTYAGQYIMQTDVEYVAYPFLAILHIVGHPHMGTNHNMMKKYSGFLDLKMELWLRNLLTRTVAIAPSLAACLIGGPDGAAKLIVIASMILSFELPFALIPLLRFTSSEAKMHQHKNSLPVSLISWLLGFCTVGINMYFISTILMRWMTSRRLPKALSTLAAAAIFPAMIAYVGMLVYLIFKPETPSDSEDSDSGNAAPNRRVSSVSGSDSAGIDRIETIEEINN